MNEFELKYSNTSTSNQTRMRDVITSSEKTLNLSVKKLQLILRKKFYAMDDIKLQIIKSILRFLRDEIEHSTLDAEQKESLDVARQCLESTYEVDGNDLASLANADDLNLMFRANSEVSEDISIIAEELKVKGNDQMKLGLYSEALDLYTKAINLNPRNPVYYCNRAAAYSRLERHWDAISDCKESIKLSRSAKAYGRMGVAYSNMHMYKEAKEAYAKAHELDPSNVTYEQNLKLAEELLTSSSTSSRSSTATAAPGAAPAGFPNVSGLDFNSFMNNPALLNMASQMLNDPSFRYIGQQLAQQMQTAYPNLMETLRSSMGGNRGPEDDQQNQDPPNPPSTGN
ncbi:small glutamine-rich tetratricopeptide repeat-containing protein alpha-like isoform X2 [Onthophagus taurus]|uniref:small glutamine-rich tetratricopeptide repeat-containing protein alpha-like isoform X2 n=1 Tax=Onthophagus taurus TaxID=166361 RepID=UPI000C2016DB|nr:small glutamine-rich tetratricopeptide repeat-containing protein alpha-like isoform X2 [Onthophagus taurus]